MSYEFVRGWDAANIKREYTNIKREYTCLRCTKSLTESQAYGYYPHWCGDKYVFIVLIDINTPVEPAEPPSRGYHRKDIERGVYGEISKVREELEELEDAAQQGVRVMIGVELSDLYGALRAYADQAGFTMSDLEKMADVTKRVFESGHRKPRG